MQLCRVLLNVVQLLDIFAPGLVDLHGLPPALADSALPRELPPLYVHVLAVHARHSSQLFPGSRSGRRHVQHPRLAARQNDLACARLRHLRQAKDGRQDVHDDRDDVRCGARIGVEGRVASQDRGRGSHLRRS